MLNRVGVQDGETVVVTSSERLAVTLSLLELDAVRDQEKDSEAVLVEPWVSEVVKEKLGFRLAVHLVGEGEGEPWVRVLVLVAVHSSEKDVERESSGDSDDVAE